MGNPTSWPFERDDPSVAHQKPTVLLDSNIWRYVFDSRAAGPLIRYARNGRYTILLAPAVLYEALRLEDGPVRDALVHLMTNPAFHRLMPEAYSESMEVLREINRTRPDWLRERPDLLFFKRLLNDWRKSTGGFWVRCRKNPEREAGYLRATEEEMIEQSRAQAIKARKEMIEGNWKRNVAMDKTLVTFPSSLPGWRGDKVEAWRVDALTILTHALGRSGNPYRDWIAPFLELDDGLLHSAAWVEFWLYMADGQALARQWIRWATSFAQRFRTVTTGTPGDSQLSTYFLEADLIISADKALISVLDEIRPFAPCRLCRGILVPAGPVGVSAVFSYLSSTA